MAKGKKTGGRTIGTPNKANADIREAIHAADPIGYLTGLLKDNSAAESVKVRAAEFLAKRLSPEAKEAPISFEIGTLEKPEDAKRALGRVAVALCNGEILPNEAKTICDIIDKYVKAYEVGELSQKVKKLEEIIR